MQLDLLAFGAHPDDVELFCSGLLLKVKKQGYKIGVIDLTRGELSTRGNPELRAEEAQKASSILQLDLRENAGLKDGDVKIDHDSKYIVINLIRKYRPKIVLAPFWEDRHPDHIHTSKLVGASFFYSGLKKIKSEYPEYRPNSLIYYFQHEITKPTFIVDVTQEFGTKLEAIRSYQSQFFNRESKEPETYISSKEFMQSVENRAKYFGFQIGVDYGEPYFVKSAVRIDNIFEIFS